METTVKIIHHLRLCILRLDMEQIHLVFRMQENGVLELKNLLMEFTKALGKEVVLTLLRLY